MSETKYDTVIGLEVHIQMNTYTKAFCGDANVFGDDANEHVSAISLALPGTLPVANHGHVKKAIQLGIALDCEISQTHYFDRKHYSYPDLPKGYQITQDNMPVCVGGHLTINTANGPKKIRIHHIHMEEDAGKSIHDQHDSYSLVDLNRAGTPLMELVTEPDLSSGEEVYQFMAELQKLLKYIGVSDADMEKGKMRCDCNVSVKPAGSTTLGERCEIKNLNSKRFARDAVSYEAKRQIKMVEAGQTFSKQTLQYDPTSKRTSIMREKEGIAEYRYFADPDLPPMHVSVAEIEALKKEIPELPQALKAKLTAEGLTDDYADQLTQHPAIYQYFEQLARATDRKSSANLLINQLLPNTSEEKLENGELCLDIDRSTAYLSLISEGKVAASAAHQKLFPEVLQHSDQSPAQLAGRLGLIITQDDGALQEIVQKVIDTNPNQVKQYKGGKKALLGYFVGAVMKSGGKGFDPKAVRTMIMQLLDQ